ncbi:hypothetical protein Tco_0201478 [Tanacetum coccineum]
MSTSKTYQQSLADAGSETRPPMLERGSYIPWASRFRRYINRKRENQKWLNKALDEGPYQFEMFIPNNSTVPKLQTAEDLQGDALLHYDAEMELMNLILLSIPNDIYNSVDACTSAKDMWKRVERLMRGTIQNKVDRETHFTNEFDQFVVDQGKHLFSLQSFWSIPGNTSSYYVTHPMSVVDYEDEYQQDDVHTNSEDPLTSAMLMKWINLLTDEQIDFLFVDALWMEELKNLVLQKELSAEQKYFPSSFIPSDKNSNATPSIPASMPSESPLIIELDKIKNCFQRLSELIQKNCKRASIFIRHLQLNDFCQDQLKPIVNELQFYFEFFKTLFQRDIKEMKDVFESTESELCELEKQNDFLKDQLLEVSLKHEVELSVLLNHECVDNSLHAEIEQLKKKSIEIQEGLQARIKILEKDVQRCEKQSVDFELKLQHEKEKHKWDSSFKNKNTNPLDYS